MEKQSIAAEQAEPHVEREVEKGPLLPAWLTTPLYVFFGAWCVFAVGYISLATVGQRQRVRALGLLHGEGLERVLPWTDARVQDAMQVFMEDPVDGLLYVEEELQRDEINDRQMARVLALKKALTWHTAGARRALLEEIISNMREDGSIEEGYELPQEHKVVLAEIISERRQGGYAGYEESKITEVLEWIQGGRQTPATGPELRRMRALEAEYDKQVFRGGEERAALELAEIWENASDPAAASLSAKLKQMQRKQSAELGPEELKLCQQYIEKWESDYLDGRGLLARAALELAKAIRDRGRRVDHGDLYQLVAFLGHRHQPVADYIEQSVYALRSNKFVIAYLAEFVKKDAVNPVMSVETDRLTKAEHHKELEEENDRRRQRCVPLLGRIAVEFCRGEFEFEGVEDPEEFFGDVVMNTFMLVTQDEDIKELVEEALEEIRQVGPQFFD